jgi:hypothetical protein
MKAQLVFPKALDNDIGAVSVNSPVFFGASLAALAIGSMILTGEIGERVVATTKIISPLLPLLLIVGLLDGLEGGPVTCAAGGRKLGVIGES